MLGSSSAHLTVVPPHGPDDAMVPGLTASTRLSAAHTGSISIVEHVFSPGVLVPPHRHTREDKISYVVEGEIGFRSDDKEVSLAAGGYIVKPRGELHSMWNAGVVPARVIEIDQPRGLRELLRGARRRGRCGRGTARPGDQDGDRAARSDAALSRSPNGAVALWRPVEVNAAAVAAAHRRGPERTAHRAMTLLYSWRNEGPCRPSTGGPRG